MTRFDHAGRTFAIYRSEAGDWYATLPDRVAAAQHASPAAQQQPRQQPPPPMPVQQAGLDPMLRVTLGELLPAEARASLGGDARIIVNVTVQPVAASPARVPAAPGPSSGHPPGVP